MLDKFSFWWFNEAYRFKPTNWFRNRCDKLAPTMKRGAWYDFSHVILHTIMHQLSVFVETSQDGEYRRDWTYSEYDRKTWERINNVYKWWHDDRIKEHKQYDDYLEERYGDISTYTNMSERLSNAKDIYDKDGNKISLVKYELALYEKDKQMLHEVVDLMYDMF